ncbi:MAG: hypothetical protein EOO11_15530 [Chitinophagaceae bacterium]|nr:MAG: hypothetical protein EOO11_15530 [Chitinophagaceae bacterium]
MRKILVTALVMIAGTMLHAQKLDDVQEKIGKGKYDEAKEKIDKAGADPKAAANSQYWFLRSQVYYNLGQQNAGDTGLSGEALRSMQRYMALESGVKDENKRMLHSMLEGHKTAEAIYVHYRNAGVKSFEAQKWAEAEANWANALAAFDYLSKSKISSSSFDTVMTTYAGYAAQNANNADRAVYYYGKLADQKIHDTTVRSVYAYLVDYYAKKKDEANFQKYLSLARQYYPENAAAWTNMEMQSVGGDKNAQLAKMASLFKQDPKNEDVANNYIVTLFNTIYRDNAADAAARSTELTAALQTVLANEPKEPYYYYVLFNHINNQVNDLETAQRAIKGTKPEDVKKRKDIDAKIDALNNVLIPYMPKAFALYDAMGAEIKAGDKANYKNMLTYMMYYHQSKKQAAEAKKYEDKMKNLK